MNKRFIYLFIALLFPLVAHSALLNLQQVPLGGGGEVTPNVILSIIPLVDSDTEIYGTSAAYFDNIYYDPMATGTYLSRICESVCTPYSGLPNVTCSVACESSAIGGGSATKSGGAGLSVAFNYSSSVKNRSNKYIFSNADNLVPSLLMPSGTNEWRHLSSSLNVLYYNPGVTYTPWFANCSGSTACADASFTAARSNPYAGTGGYSITKNLVNTAYNVWIDNRKSDDKNGPSCGIETNYASGSNDFIDLWDSYVKVTFTSSGISVTGYRITSTAGPASAPGGLTITPVSGTPKTFSSSTACYDILGPQNLVKSLFGSGTSSNSYGNTDGPGCKTIAQAKQNFANWYQYHRKLILRQKGAYAYILNQYPNLNYGLLLYPRLFVPVSTGNSSSVLNSLLSFELPNNNPSPQTGPADMIYAAGAYYQNGTGNNGVSPIQYSCQKNYVVAWADSDSLGSTTISSIPTSGNKIYDGANYYYNTDLASSLANNVGSTPADPATWQHMVSILHSSIQDSTVNFVGNPPRPPSSDTNANNSTSIYANYSSALSLAASYGHGLFSIDSFKNDNTWIDDAFTLIQQNLGTASSTTPLAAVSQNSTVLSATSAIYQPSYNLGSASGDVKAYSISASGVLSSTPTYSANCLLTGGTCMSPAGTNTAPVPSNRVVITRSWTGSNTGIAFTFPATDTTTYNTHKAYTNFINLMKYAPNPVSTSTSSQITANRNYGAALVNYLRGSRTQEVQANATYDFRDRTGGILGDIIESSPIYVGPPSRGYPDTIETAAYSSFKTLNAARAPMLYVGANDGMLHAFDAATGVEKLAYIPGARQIYAKLPELSRSTYSHFFFVNATPVAADVFYNGAWRTILATTLGNGGQSLSILDITNPANFTDANAATIYLSEFNDTNDADLGYIQGTPIIAKVRSGTGSKWAIIMNNGYNNSEADDYASTTGQAALYILFIEAGLSGGWIADTSYIKIPVGTGSVETPNGLSTPFAIDTDGDYVVDYVYAGDLQGNMWRFNLTSMTPTTWKTAATTLFTASNSVAGDQPITSAPYVTAHPTGIANGVMVYFGTGKYLEPTDVSQTGQATQAFYGIWDQMAGTTVAKNKLLQQQILGTATSGGNNYRLVTNNPIVWTAGATQNLGWYLNLIDNSVGANRGERVIANPLIRNANVVFSTLIPTAVACGSPTSWLMELDAATGGRTSSAPFDINNDGVFSAPDYITVGSVTAPPSGIMPSIGAFLSPVIFATSTTTKEVKVLNGTGGLGTVNENPGNTTPAATTGRKSWRQLN